MTGVQASAVSRTEAVWAHGELEAMLMVEAGDRSAFELRAHHACGAQPELASKEEEGMFEVYVRGCDETGLLPVPWTPT
jgi:hypothetical protein